MITENSPLASEYCLVLDRKDLRSLYERLESEEDWHRLSQRIYVLNKSLGRRGGARFVIHREKASVRVYFSSPDKLRSLLAVLRGGRGFVQKALADRLEAKAGQACDRRSVPDRVRQRQCELLKEMLSRDLGLFAAADLDAVLVDVPGPAGGTLAAQLAGFLPGGALVLGETGSGKTALFYSLLKNWERFGSRVSGHAPIYLPARHLKFEWGRFEILWEALPGVEPGMTERLGSAFAEGRLALLIDAAHESPACVDFANPGVQSFWQAASRNACVLSLSQRFFDSHIQVSPLKSYFPAGLPAAALPAWGSTLFQGLFERLSSAFKKTGNSQWALLAGHLDKLSVDDWQRVSPLLRPTPLTGLACANFFLSRQGSRLPKDEYELIEHATAFTLRHEGFKASLAPAETVLGLLMRLAWKAFSQGRGGRLSCVSTDDAGAVLRESFPALEERKTEVFHLLSQLPHLNYSPESGLFCMNALFADFLAARHLLLSFLAGDLKRIREALGAPWDNPRLERLYFLGLAGFGRQEKQQHLQASQSLYDACRREGAGPADLANELVLTRLLEPLGLLNLPEATDFLWNVFNESKEGAEPALLASAIGLARAGESDALEVYIERLRKSQKAAQFGLNWLLFDRRHDRSRMDIENFTPDLIGRWEGACEWLLATIASTERHHIPLRPLHAFLFCQFLKTMGPGPFIARKEENGTGEAKVAERLKLAERALAALARDPHPALARQTEELSALLEGSRTVVVRARPGAAVSVGRIREQPPQKDTAAARRIA